MTVTERYTGTDATGNPVPSEHKVSAVTSVSVHDSVKENGELATAFLTDFSNSSVSPEAAVRYFYTGCPGRQDELKDIQDNRAKYLITAHKLGSPAVNINFGGVCAFRVDGRRRVHLAVVRMDLDGQSDRKTRRSQGARAIWRRSTATRSGSCATAISRTGSGTASAFMR